MLFFSYQKYWSIRRVVFCSKIVINGNIGRNHTIANGIMYERGIGIREFA